MDRTGALRAHFWIQYASVQFGPVRSSSVHPLQSSVSLLPRRHPCRRTYAFMCRHTLCGWQRPTAINITRIVEAELIHSQQWGSCENRSLPHLLLGRSSRLEPPRGWHRTDNSAGGGGSCGHGRTHPSAAALAAGGEPGAVRPQSSGAWQLSRTFYPCTRLVAPAC